MGKIARMKAIWKRAPRRPQAGPAPAVPIALSPGVQEAHDAIHAQAGRACAWDPTLPLDRGCYLRERLARQALPD